MPNLISLLRSRSINELDLPGSLKDKVKAEKVQTLWDLFTLLQKKKANPEITELNFSPSEIQVIDKILKDFISSNQSDRPTKPTVSASEPVKTPAPRPQNKPIATKVHRILGNELVEKESVYSPKLRSVELVGEIPISSNELSVLGNLFRNVFIKHPVKIALEAVEKGAPASFAVFLVGRGVFGYNGGDYWSSVENALGCKTGFVFGQVFERILHRYRLVSFEELQKKSTRYVSLILAHGGIPVYSLDDYFSNYILASVNRPQYMGLDGDEVLSELLLSPAVLTTDKPVTHFLEYGGRVALDIFNRSRHLIAQWQDGQTIPDIDETGLPNHMVERFTEWVKKTGSPSSPAKSSKNRVRKPEFCLDPWGLGIFLKLPSQYVPVFDTSDCRWVIQSGSNAQFIPIEIDVHGYTREITIRVDIISEIYEVKFIQGDKELQWKFSAPNSIFIFDPNHGAFQNRFSNNEVWVIYPNHLDLSITDGDGYQTEELPSLPGNWYSMKAEGWELTNARDVSFFSQSTLVKSFEIKQTDWIQPAFLTGGTILRNNLQSNEPTYLGRPPKIRIPVREGVDTLELLGRWRISIKPVGFADPPYPRQAKLSDLSDTALLVSDAHIDVSLDHKSLLDLRPAGVFQIIMWGPLGQDVNFRISCWSECDISGIDEIYIPDRQGAKPVQVDIHSGLLDQLEPTDNKNDFKVNNSKPGLFSVTVPSDKSRVLLQVFRDTLEGTLGIPLEFRVKRLRWRLVGHDVVEGWSDNLLEVGVDSFAQMSTPLLIVSWPDLDFESFELYLRLLDLNANEILKIDPAKGNTRRSGDFWRFDLDVLRSNLQESRAPIVRLELVARTIEGSIQKQLPVISFTRSINIQQISVELQEGETEFNLDLHWHEPSPLQNRCVYLWSLWRPWEAVRRIDIPDSAKDQHVFTLEKEDFLPGEYRLGFAIVDPWVSTLPPVKPPKGNTPGVWDFGVAPEQRLDYLNKQAKSFEEHLEILMLKKPTQLTQDALSCLSYLDQASASQILLLKEHFEELEEENIMEMFGEAVLAAKNLGLLLDEIKKGNLTSSDVTSILEYMPPINEWQTSSCELLLKFDNRKWRAKALQHLISTSPEFAAQEALSMIKKGLFEIEDAVELLFENRPRIIEIYKTEYPNDPTAKKIVEFLQLYNPYSGLPVVRVGMWIHTDAGWGKIDSIQDMVSHTSVDEFMENQGVYKLVVRLHIEIDPNLQGEKAVIDMKQKTLTFQRARGTYICDHCQEFKSTNRDMYKFHIAQQHPGQYPSTPSSQTSFTYAFLEFVHSRK